MTPVEVPNMVSRTAKYALQVLGYLAEHPDRLTPRDALSEATGIPANYLSKVLAQLRKQGLVHAEKGWGGGFRLHENAAKRPIRDVVGIIDGVDNKASTGCLFGLPDCDPDNPCPLHPYWARIKETYEEMVSRTLIQDLGR